MKRVEAQGLIAAMLDAIFHRELLLVFEAFCHGDRMLFAASRQLDRAAVIVHFRSHLARYNRVETWGVAADHHFEEP